MIGANTITSIYMRVAQAQAGILDCSLDCDQPVVLELTVFFFFLLSTAEAAESELPT